MKDNKTELGGLFYPTKDQEGNPVPFDSLFIPYIYKEIYFEGVYIDVLNQQKDMVIVDVGANIGVTVDHFRKHAKKVYAIEPSPEHFAALKKNKEFNNWDNVELFEYALADKDGELEFAQNMGNRTMNSLVPDQVKSRQYKQKLMVKAKSIDNFFEENKIDHVDFCKMDPEGSEDMILRSDGFRKVAPKINSMMCEFHFPTWPSLVDYICKEFGYQARRYESSAIIVLFFKA